MQLSGGRVQVQHIVRAKTRNRTFALAKQPGASATGLLGQELYGGEGHKHVPCSCVAGVPASAIVIVRRGLRMRSIVNLS